MPRPLKARLRNRSTAVVAAAAKALSGKTFKPKPTVAKVAKQVRRLKYAVAGETKSYDAGSTGRVIGQLTTAGNSPTDQGWVCDDITPLPGQGVEGNRRIGNKINLKSIQFSFQAEQQKALSCRMRLKMFIVRVLGNPVDTSPVGVQSTMSKFLLPNPTSGYTDYHSRRNPEYFRNFKVLAKKNFSIQPDQIRLDATGAYAAQITDIEINKKIYGSVDWDSFDTEKLSHGQILLIIVANTGNCGQSNVNNTTGSIFNEVANSGAVFMYDYRWNFTDK